MTEIIQTNLLVGGPFDRQTLRYQVDTDMPWVDLTATRRAYLQPPPHGDFALHIETHQYHREQVTMPRYVFLFWRHEDMEPHDAFKALFAAYGNGDTAP